MKFESTLSTNLIKYLKIEKRSGVGANEVVQISRYTCDIKGVFDYCFFSHKYLFAVSKAIYTSETSLSVAGFINDLYAAIVNIADVCKNKVQELTSSLNYSERLGSVFLGV